MHGEHVFGDRRPFSQCHAATLIRRRDGGLLVAWFGGTRESHRDTAIWAAEREPLARRPPSAGARPGAAWTAPRIIARASPARDAEADVSAARSGERLPHWNPVLFSPSEGKTALHFKLGRSIRSWQTFAQYSEDEGRTWTEARPLVVGDRGGRGAVKNKPIQLETGAWLAGASLERWRRWDAFFDRSETGLGDWQASDLIRFDRRAYPTKGIIQPTLWQADDGTVHALFRSTAGRLFGSRSTDDGRNWTEAFATEIPNNNSGIDAVRLPGGLIALACNPVGGNWAARTPLCVLFSRDEGKTWPARIDLESGPGEYSYPALIAADDGICVAYTWNRRRIALSWIGLDEIPDF
jgi:predicted neuraminidase